MSPGELIGLSVDFSMSADLMLSLSHLSVLGWVILKALSLMQIIVLLLQWVIQLVERNKWSHCFRKEQGL
ncbi:hypothetical protein P308_08480 [Pseudomonas piscis]|nr:hypothetical protein P308_08480 [Pseudomonas piscis]